MARPKKSINWDQVEQRMESGSPAKEIAGALHINIDTFYDRFKEEFGSSFSDYSDHFHSGGKSNLRYKQYSKAMEGSVQMLIWLGKNWLGQKDKEEAEEVDETQEGQYGALMHLLSALQSGARNISNIKSNEEHKS